MMGLIVETHKHGACTCHYDDGAYKDKTEEEVQRIIENFSAFVFRCLQKKKTAEAVERRDKPCKDVGRAGEGLSLIHI